MKESLSLSSGAAAVISSESAALDHVAGYSIFNDGTIRDYRVPYAAMDHRQELPTAPERSGRHL